MDISAIPRAKVRGAFLSVGICVGVVFFYLIFMVHNLHTIGDIDALDNAQIARNLAQGHGFSTDFIKPLTLTRVRQLDHQPDLIFSPLHPLLMSLFIRAMGANNRAVALASGLPFLLTLLVTYFLGLRMFDRRVALLGTAMFGLYLGTLTYSISGLEVCLLGLWVALLFLVLYRLGEKEKWQPGLVAIAGVLLGAVCLTKEVWVVLVAPALVYLFFAVEPRYRWKALGLALAAFVVVMLPWCVRAVHLTGNPLFSWRWYESEMDTMTNPGNTLYRSYRADVQSPITFLLYHPGEFYDKILAGMVRMYVVMTTLSGPFVLSFFVVAVLVPLGRPNLERLRYVVYATYVLLYAVLCWIMPSARLFYPLAPIVAVIAAGLFLRVVTPLLKRYGPCEEARALQWAIIGFVLLQAMPLLVNLMQRTRPSTEVAAGETGRLCQQVAENTTGVIVSDVPWDVAWYGNRTSVWLPRTWDDLDRMELDVGQIQYLLLTPAVAGEEEMERTSEWAKLWGAAQSNPRGEYKGFVVYKLLGNSPPYWVLLRKSVASPSRPVEGGEGG